jgi:NAD-dependent SIR2 family protein deacetylase
MQLEKIFELIRKEQVILWIGSGFSIAGGYPSGRDLSALIYDTLLPEERAQIGSNLSLTELTEQFVRLRSNSKKELFAMLQKVFSKPPVTGKWHELLSHIPHIKTIITTNYDQLFERAYRKDIHTILTAPDLAQADHRTELFKIHGDINDPESIIITKSDYRNFFYQNVQHSLVWAAIKARIANKVVVFIGYDLEDDNVLNMFREVFEQLGTHRKEAFLIAPNLPAHKVNYLAGLDIQYLNFKGEPFVNKLHENIKDRITTDFANGWVSPETLRLFYQKNNLSVKLEALPDRFLLTGVKPVAPLADSKIHMEFKQDKKFMQSFESFARGKVFGKLSIGKENLNVLKILLNQVNIIDDNADYRISLQSVPFKTGKANLVFEDGTEFESIQYKSYRSKEMMELVGEYKGCQYRYQFSSAQFKASGTSVSSSLTLDIAEKFASVNDVLAASRLALRLVKGMGCTVYIEGDPKGIYIKPEGTGNWVNALENNLEFFEALKKIEKSYKVRFENFGNCTKTDFENGHKAAEFANGGVHEQEWDDEITWDLDKGVSLDLLLKINEGSKFEAVSRDLEEVVVYGHKIRLGYLVLRPLDLYIVNLEEVQRKLTNLVKVRSKSKTIRIYYVSEPPTAGRQNEVS